ncbi:MAG: DoxX family protein [Fulvivirga sp.]
MLDYVEIALKCIIGLSVLNVWLIRSSQSTQWRGADAQNIKEEFAAYGLPSWFMVVVGTLKVVLSIGLMASIWYPMLELYCAGGIAVLMLGAVGMHIKVSDPLKKSFPAALFLVLSVIILLI